MFKNPGRKLQGLAKFIFVLTIVIFALGAIGLIIAAISQFSYRQTGSGILMIVLAILSVALGIIFGWLSSIVLYAIGQLVDDNQRMREILEGGTPQIAPQAPVARPNVTPAAAPVNEVPLNVAMVPDAAPVVEEMVIEETVIEEPVVEVKEPAFPDGWDCPACGLRNSKLVTICMGCGERKDSVKKENICPNCGSKANAGESFCRNCGTKIG